MQLKTPLPDCQLMEDPMHYHRITDPSSKCLSAYKDSHGGGGQISGGVLGERAFPFSMLAVCP